MSTPTSTSSTPPTPLLPHPNLLLAAVAALRDKLIAASVSATPEELAYLASALDKLAGQVGLLDIAEATDAARQTVRTALDKLAGQVGLLDIAEATDAARQTVRTALDDMRQSVAEEADGLRREVLGVIAQREANSVGVITQSAETAIATADAVVAARIQEMRDLAQSLRESLPNPSPGYQWFFIKFVS